MTDDWPARLAAQTAAYLARRERRRADRTARQERRDAGLAARHTAKLTRTHQEDQPDA